MCHLCVRGTFNDIIMTMTLNPPTQASFSNVLIERRLDTLEASTTSERLLESVDLIRLDAFGRLDPAKRARLGQFATPSVMARFMASLFSYNNSTINNSSIHLLDAGAGVGSLTAAFIANLIDNRIHPAKMTVTAYELEKELTDYLQIVIEMCKRECQRIGISFLAEVIQNDFIQAAASIIRRDLFASPHPGYTHAILNPPYGKINVDSKIHRLLSSLGIQTPNLYAAFLTLAIELLAPGGELVAITPRSFCNGPYFKSFRRNFLTTMGIRRIHIFESRDHAFRDDEVLQETIIFHAVKEERKPTKLIISSSITPEDENILIKEVDYTQLVIPDDPEFFIHVVPDTLAEAVARKMQRFTTSLTDLGITVSTGRVVDFRATEFLRSHSEPDTVPLIYPSHFANGFIQWPNLHGKKPNAIVASSATDNLLLPPDVYVLVKRFSTKEEHRRVVAALCDLTNIQPSRLAFENHLNYYHDHGHGLPLELAKGLTAFLNSSLVDAYFRQFNGHTQINATDLRNIKYPSRVELEALSAYIGHTLPNQDDLDRYIEQEFFLMEQASNNPDPIRAKKKIEETRGILKELGFPSQQQNERSALTLLALLDLKPDMPWSEATNPLMGITPMMEFFAHHYGKRYAPNTRETVRRQTIHQFITAGLVVQNPDDPARPINSGKNVYQLKSEILTMLRTFGSTNWEGELQSYLTSPQAVNRQYKDERDLRRIPLVVGNETLLLSPGGQNVLIEKIISDFCPRFTPGGALIYIGDTDTKWAYFKPEILSYLGILIDSHGKMPDVVVYYEETGWLVLIEAVTSHGPVNPKRRNELQLLFSNTKAALVFVTAFLDRKSMARFLRDISWETEVWIADAPDHLIHFNGERFLGPF